jgi:uncharacterized membrane protein YciS (DUF1049 family)
MTCLILVVVLSYVVIMTLPSLSARLILFSLLHRLSLGFRLLLGIDHIVQFIMTLVICTLFYKEREKERRQKKKKPPRFPASLFIQSPVDIFDYILRICYFTGIIQLITSYGLSHFLFQRLTHSYTSFQPCFVLSFSGLTGSMSILL